MTEKISLEKLRVLIIEDGNEYLDNLSRFVLGPHYEQAHSFKEALRILERKETDIIYLDMRFDRTSRQELTGDLEAATKHHNGDEERAWKYLANNQGLFILEALKKRALGSLPVILSYDFSNEQRRLENLLKIYPNLRWVRDAVTSEEICNLMVEAVTVR